MFNRVKDKESIVILSSDEIQLIARLLKIQITPCKFCMKQDKEGKEFYELIAAVAHWQKIMPKKRGKR